MSQQQQQLHQAGAGGAGGHVMGQGDELPLPLEAYNDQLLPGGDALSPFLEPETTFRSLPVRVIPEDEFEQPPPGSGFVPLPGHQFLPPPMVVLPLEGLNMSTFIPFNNSNGANAGSNLGSFVPFAGADVGAAAPGSQSPTPGPSSALGQQPGSLGAPPGQVILPANMPAGETWTMPGPDGRPVTFVPFTPAQNPQTSQHQQYRTFSPALVAPQVVFQNEDLINRHQDPFNPQDPAVKRTLRTMRVVANVILAVQVIAAAMMVLAVESMLGDPAFRQFWAAFYDTSEGHDSSERWLFWLYWFPIYTPDKDNSSPTRLREVYVTPLGVLMLLVSIAALMLVVYKRRTLGEQSATASCAVLGCLIFPSLALWPWNSMVSMVWSFSLTPDVTASCANGCAPYWTILTIAHASQALVWAVPASLLVLYLLGVSVVAAYRANRSDEEYWRSQQRVIEAQESSLNQLYNEPPVRPHRTPATTTRS